jgi:hypothetical protein
MVELVEKPRLGATGLIEGSRADDLAGPSVRDPKHYGATALVCERNAVFNQLLELESAGRGLELYATILGTLE